MKHNSFQNGFALIESMVAIVVLAIGVLGAIGLQARATAAISESQARTEATIAAENLLGLIWNDQTNAGNYVTGAAGLSNWLADLDHDIPGATATVAINPTTYSPAPGVVTTSQNVTITIRWKRSASGDENQHVISARLETAR